MTHKHISQTIANCWTEERNDAGLNCYECEKCGVLLETEPSCMTHKPSLEEALKKRLVSEGVSEDWLDSHLEFL